MSGPLDRRTIRSRVWAGARLRSTATLATLVLLLAFAVRADLPDMVPASVSCDSVGYAYDAAGQLAGVQDQAGRTARYRYDPTGNITSVANDGSPAPALALLSVVPARAAVGAEVTLQGGCFSDVAAENTVTFHGVPATVTRADGRRLVARVPAGATTGLVTVTVGGTTATSPQSFVVTGPDESAPTVTAVTPPVVTPGGTVTVTGTGFAAQTADNAVTLNRTRAFPSTVAAGSLTVEVPAGVASGRIGVRTAHGSGESAADVFVAPAPYTVADVAHTARVALGVTTSVPIASAGDIALVVFDLAEGQRASVQLADGTFGSCGISTAKLLDPFGRTAASAGCVGATGFIDTVTARTAGTYTLLLAASSTATGSVSATVREVPADATAGTTAGGEAVTVTTTVPGQNGTVTFAGSTGQRVSVKLSGGTYGTYNAAVTLRRPGGGTVVSNGSCGASCFLDTTVLPTEGTYTLVVDPQSTTTGTITVQVYDVPADATVAATPGGPPGDGDHDGARPEQRHLVPRHGRPAGPGPVHRRDVRDVQRVGGGAQAGRVEPDRQRDTAAARASSTPRSCRSTARTPSWSTPTPATSARSPCRSTTSRRTRRRPPARAAPRSPSPPPCRGRTPWSPSPARPGSGCRCSSPVGRTGRTTRRRWCVSRTGRT